MSKTSFDESKALALYHAHKTDTEIAKGVDSLTATIRNWRKYRGLPNISPNARPRARASYPQARKIINQVKGIGGGGLSRSAKPFASRSHESIPPSTSLRGTRVCESRDKARRERSHKRLEWQNQE